MHVKLDTGHGAVGTSELPSPSRDVVGVMTHLATADTDLEFARLQIERFREATAARASSRATSRTAPLRCGCPSRGSTPPAAGSPSTGSRRSATDAAEDGLEPVLSWTSELALSRLLRAGESTGYGRRFVAERDTWIAIVPVGYADGFRRDLTGTEVLVAGERRRVVGTVSMDAFAVELDRELPPGTPVTIIGDGLSLEEHARVAGTITYELASRLVSSPERATTDGGCRMSSKPERFASAAGRARGGSGAPSPRAARAHGDERALDVGAGTGALAYALAPHVREVVALEIDPAMAERAKADAPRTSRSWSGTASICRSRTSPSISPPRCARFTTHADPSF